MWPLSHLPVRIDRCLCFNVTFADLARAAEATGAASVEALQQHRTFGHKCRLCHPYVRRMLRSGETVFYRVVTDAAEPMPSSGTPPAP